MPFFFKIGGFIMPRQSREKEFDLEIDESVNDVFDEVPGSSFLALRKLRWSKSSNYKLDIRKWYTDSEGKEIAGKGVAFMTEEGPGNLIEVLLKHGYGDTRKTLNGIKDREDFLPAVKEIIIEKGVDYDSIEVNDLTSIGGDFYDPKSII